MKFAYGVFLSLLALTGAATPATAQAQDEFVGIPETMNELSAFFSTGSDYRIRNWRTVAEGWDMTRGITGATVLRHCYVELATPKVIAAERAWAPHPTYGLPFDEIREVEWQGDRIVRYRADHMTPDEHGYFEFPDEESAGFFAYAVRYLAVACGGIR